MFHRLTVVQFVPNMSARHPRTLSPTSSAVVQVLFCRLTPKIRIFFLCVCVLCVCVCHIKQAFFLTFHVFGFNQNIINIPRENPEQTMSVSAV